MLAKVISCTIVGLEGAIVEVKVDISPSLHSCYLSAHALHRILKLAQTIADLENDDIIKAHHLAESIQYRPRVLV